MPFFFEYPTVEQMKLQTNLPPAKCRWIIHNCQALGHPYGLLVFGEAVHVTMQGAPFSVVYNGIRTLQQMKPMWVKN